MTKVFVIWSGGHDSTLTLWKAIQDSSKKNPVTVMTFTSREHHQKQYEGEKRARQRILKELKRRGYHVKQIEARMSSRTDQLRGSGLIQQVWWAVLGAFYIEHEAELWTGYISSDDYWQHRGDIECAFHDITKTFGKKCVIKHPLHIHRKYDVVEDLPKWLSKLCWTCDSPKGGKQCGRCYPCVNYKMAKERLKINKNNSELARRNNDE